MKQKRTLFRLAIAVLVFVSVACTCAIPGLSSRPSIVGNWEANYRGDRIGFIFESDGDFSILVNGDTAGQGRYTVNYAATPYQLDLLYDDGVRVYTIFEFTDSNTMHDAFGKMQALTPPAYNVLGLWHLPADQPLNQPNVYKLTICPFKAHSSPRRVRNGRFSGRELTG